MALKNFRQRCGGRKQGKQHKFEKKPTNPAMLSQQNNPTKNPTPPSFIAQFWVCLHIKFNSNDSKFSMFTNTVLPKNTCIFLLISHIFLVRKPGIGKGSGRLISVMNSAWGALPNCFISITADFLMVMNSSGCQITRQLRDMSVLRLCHVLLVLQN